MNVTKSWGWSGVAPIGVVAGWFLLPHLWRLREERRLARTCEAHGLLALTYDDGPGSSLTTRLLDLLASRGATATFFMLGERVSQRPELARRVIDLGHVVGSHTHGHSNAWRTNPVRVGRDINEGVREVDGIGGSGRLYRPPYGKVTLATLLHARLDNLRFGWWTVDSRDSWKRRPTEAVVQQVRGRGGAVVLMHDFDSYGLDTDKVSHEDYVLDLTGRLLELAEDEGLRLVTLPEVHRLLISNRGDGPTPGLRVLAVASGGGHWTQLYRLRQAWDGCDVTYVTTDPGYRESVLRDASNRNQQVPRFMRVVEANRWQKLRMLRLLLELTVILIRVRPDAVITTGAAPGYFAIRLGRLLGARTAWIDSIANAEELSLSGRRVGHHADAWLTQWQHLEEPGGPSYRGAVL